MSASKKADVLYDVSAVRYIVSLVEFYRSHLWLNFASFFEKHIISKNNFLKIMCSALFTSYSVANSLYMSFCLVIGGLPTFNLDLYISSASNYNINAFLKLTYMISMFSSLGMNHDRGDCPDGLNIMASYPAGKKSAFQWSPCSKNYLQQFLK